MHVISSGLRLLSALGMYLRTPGGAFRALLVADSDPTNIVIFYGTNPYSAAPVSSYCFTPLGWYRKTAMPNTWVLLNASISTDGGNQVTLGSDSGLYVGGGGGSETLVSFDPDVPSAAVIQSGAYQNFVYSSDYGLTSPTIVLPVITPSTPRLLRFAYATSNLAAHNGTVTIQAGAGNSIATTIEAGGEVVLGQLLAQGLAGSGVTLGHEAGSTEWHILSHTPIP
jgi:hypothetical protein